MKPYAVGLTLLLGISLALAWHTGSAPGLRARNIPPPAPRSVFSSPPATPSWSETPSPRLSRNPFEYADPNPLPSRSLPVARPPLPSPSPTEAAAPRLVGFLRRAGALKAILSVRGEVFVLAVGEEGGGYTLIAADEERGVRLTGPDRTKVELTLPASSGY